MPRRFGVGGGAVTGGTGSGGTPYNPKQKKPPGPPTDPYITPPPLSFDPSIEAQRRASQRGLEDTEGDIATKEHFGEKDLDQALRDIRTKTSRSRGDINRNAFRAGRTLDSQEQDANTRGRRANEDFDTQLANIGRQFAQLGHRQGEAANAAGVNDAGTTAASGAARAGNQRLAEAPIGVARGRTNEDLATALARIGTGRSDLGEDQTRSLTQLTQDRNRDRNLTKQERGREEFTNQRTEERARREGAISDVDLLTQEIYAARAEHPAVFKQWKLQHPDAVAQVEGKAAPGGGSGGGGQGGGSQGGGTKTGGTSAPGNKKKKGGR